MTGAFAPATGKGQSLACSFSCRRTLPGPLFEECGGSRWKPSPQALRHHKDDLFLGERERLSCSCAARGDILVLARCSRMDSIKFQPGGKNGVG
jgi:hypothetical protein